MLEAIIIFLCLALGIGFGLNWWLDNIINKILAEKDSPNRNSALLLKYLKDRNERDEEKQDKLDGLK